MTRGLMTREVALTVLMESYGLPEQRARVLIRLAGMRPTVVWNGLRIRMHVQGGIVLFSLEEIS